MTVVVMGYGSRMVIEKVGMLWSEVEKEEVGWGGMEEG